MEVHDRRRIVAQQLPPRWRGSAMSDTKIETDSPPDEESLNGS